MANLFSTTIADGIATILLDDAGAQVNTVSPTWIADMEDTLAGLKHDADVHGVIITSAKAGFMAGADLKLLLVSAKDMSHADAFAFSQRASKLFREIEQFGKPVVAALSGFALGGGYELALACHHRIVADDPRAVVGLPEVGVGLMPGAGGTQRLPRLVGMKPALEMLLSGKSFKPTEALAAGLVDAVVPPRELLEAARSWLAEHREAVQPWDLKGYRPEGSAGLMDPDLASFFALATARLHAQYGDNYPAPLAILTCVFEGIQLPLDKALLVESRQFARLLVDPVGRNIIRTLFINKPAAERGARRPAGIPSSNIVKLGVLGAGMMGAGVAYVAALANIEVILLDRTAELADDGKNYARKLVAASVTKGRMSQENADALLARIRPTADYSELAGCELVIENVFEDRAIKGEVTRRAAQVLGDHAVFASNTSTLPITGLAEAFPRAADFIGLHFFSPVDRMPLVEIIMGRTTGDAALARALDFVAQIRKTPIVVNDARGFYTSRVFLSYAHEGAELLREGVRPELIENAARQAGMPVGPLAVTDEVTLELPIKIERQAEREDPAYARRASLDVLETMAGTLGRPGRKGGAGFYEYPAEGPKTLWPGLAEHFPAEDLQPSVAEVRKRLLYRQALETARCLEEGVLNHPADADLGAVLGWGFPSWTGGTLSLIETVGVARFISECDELADRHGERFRPGRHLREMAAEQQGFNWS